MDIFNYLEEMQKDLVKYDSATFEKKYYEICLEKSGEWKVNWQQAKN